MHACMVKLGVEYIYTHGHQYVYIDTSVISVCTLIFSVAPDNVS